MEKFLFKKIRNMELVFEVDRCIYFMCSDKCSCFCIKMCDVRYFDFYYSYV